MSSSTTSCRGTPTGWNSATAGSTATARTSVVEISYLYLADTRDEEILQRLREKLAEITRQLGSSSDVLGIGGRGEVIDALLEDLPLRSMEARLERAAAAGPRLP